MARLGKVVRADQAGVKSQPPFAGPSFLNLEGDIARRGVDQHVKIGVLL